MEIAVTHEGAFRVCHFSLSKKNVPLFCVATMVAADDDDGTSDVFMCIRYPSRETTFLMVPSVGRSVSCSVSRSVMHPE